MLRVDGGKKKKKSAFEGQTFKYPHRRVTQEDNDISLPGTKRSGLPDASGGDPSAGHHHGRAKRLKEG